MNQKEELELFFKALLTIILKLGLSNSFMKKLFSPGSSDLRTGFYSKPPDKYQYLNSIFFSKKYQTYYFQGSFYGQHEIFISERFQKILGQNDVMAPCKRQL